MHKFWQVNNEFNSAAKDGPKMSRMYSRLGQVFKGRLVGVRVRHNKTADRPLSLELHRRHRPSDEAFSGRLLLF